MKRKKRRREAARTMGRGDSQGVYSKCCSSELIIIGVTVFNMNRLASPTADNPEYLLIVFCCLGSIQRLARWKFLIFFKFLLIC